MDWLAYPLRDFLVWLFENIWEPLSNSPNTLFFFIFIVGATYWLLLQHKLNKKAEADPNQIK